jgi:hypothetical protein
MYILSNLSCTNQMDDPLGQITLVMACHLSPKVDRQTYHLKWGDWNEKKNTWIISEIRNHIKLKEHSSCLYRILHFFSRHMSLYKLFTSSHVFSSHWFDSLSLEVAMHKLLQPNLPTSYFERCRCRRRRCTSRAFTLSRASASISVLVKTACTIKFFPLRLLKYFFLPLKSIIQSERSVFDLQVEVGWRPHVKQPSQLVE